MADQHGAGAEHVVDVLPARHIGHVAAVGGCQHDVNLFGQPEVAEPSAGQKLLG